MTDIMRTGVSALVAFQRALATTSHNISNSNTEGYSRQRVELSTRLPSGFGDGFLGNGVQTTTVQRVVEEFNITQLRNSTTQLGQLSAFSELATRVDNVLGDPNTGIASGMQEFFNTWQTVANDPASLTSRTLLLQQAEALADRFRQTAGRLDAIARDVNARISTAVGEINALASGIARINDQIIAAEAAVGGQPANDLLDQRDQLLLQLGRLTSVSTNVESNGSLSVFIGTGQALVLQNRAVPLEAVPNEFDPSRLDVAYVSGGARQIVTNTITGGELGGALQFRGDLLDQARNALGQIATGLAEAVNGQQAQGMNLRGQLGQAIFGLDAPQALAGGSNGSSAVLTASRLDVGALTTDDYVVTYSGGTWSVRTTADRTVAFTGTGTALDPLRFEGLSITSSVVPADGDRFLVRPTAEAALSMRVTMTDPRGIAAAAPIRTSADAANVGNGTITSGTVVNAASATLLNPVVIRFVSATQYTIDGALPAQTYTAGADIDVNGWRVQIGGAPVAGDTFRVGPNTGGVADNRNALAMAGLQTRGVLNGGSTSVGQAFGSLIGETGATSRQVKLSRDAQAAIANDAKLAVLDVSGVNIDEEAADMLRWQQAYGAAAKVIAVADELFNTLLGVVRR